MKNSNVNLRKLKAALRLGRRGLRVFLIHGIRKGQCTCGKPKCPRPGKHPIYRGWREEATSDKRKIRAAFKLYPFANIAVVTGGESGPIVVDVDGRTGKKTFSSLQLGKECLGTLTAITGRGMHLYFGNPGLEIGNSAGKIGTGVDIRGTGGFVVAAPSRHANGKEYRYIDGDAPILPLPEKLKDLLNQPTHEKKARGDCVLLEGERNSTLTSIGGTLCRKGLGEDVICDALQLINKRACNPPLSQHEVLSISDSVARYAPAKEVSWPRPLNEDAYYGPVGKILRRIEPQTEADPAALLIQLLAGIGNLIGLGPHFEVEATNHSLKLFVAVVGETSKGRKGTSMGYIDRLLRPIDDSWRWIHGLSSGEGLVHAFKQLPNAQTGDRRLFAVEEEFSSVLRRMDRQGSTLSEVLRQAWDSDHLEVITKKDPVDIKRAHLSVITHTTREDLLSELGRNSIFNGFANRFLWVAARRARLLPSGGCLTDKDFVDMRGLITPAIAAAKSISRMHLTPNAQKLWDREYGLLSSDLGGMLGKATSRAEAQVIRIASAYAVLGKNTEIKTQHLKAALEVWRYCRESAAYIFRPNKIEDSTSRILSLIRSRPSGITRTEINSHFNNHLSAATLGAALEDLSVKGLIHKTLAVTGGRSAERWHVKKGTDR